MIDTLHQEFKLSRYNNKDPPEMIFAAASTGNGMIMTERWKGFALPDDTKPKG